MRGRRRRSVAGTWRSVKSFTGGGSGGSPASGSHRRRLQARDGEALRLGELLDASRDGDRLAGRERGGAGEEDEEPFGRRGVVVRAGRLDPEAGVSGVPVDRRHDARNAEDPASFERRAVARALDPGDGHRALLDREDEEGRRLLGGIEVVVADEDERARVRPAAAGRRPSPRSSRAGFPSRSGRGGASSSPGRKTRPRASRQRRRRSPPRARRRRCARRSRFPPRTAARGRGAGSRRAGGGPTGR